MKEIKVQREWLEKLVKLGEHCENNMVNIDYEFCRSKLYYLFGYIESAKSLLEDTNE